MVFFRCQEAFRLYEQKFAEDRDGSYRGSPKDVTPGFIGKTLEKPSKNHEKPWKKPGKPWENHRKTMIFDGQVMGKTVKPMGNSGNVADGDLQLRIFGIVFWFYGDSMGFTEIKHHETWWWLGLKSLKGLESKVAWESSPNSMERWSAGRDWAMFDCRYICHTGWCGIVMDVYRTKWHLDTWAMFKILLDWWFMGWYYLVYWGLSQSMSWEILWTNQYKGRTFRVLNTAQILNVYCNQNRMLNHLCKLAWAMVDSRMFSKPLLGLLGFVWKLSTSTLHCLFSKSPRL